MGVSGTVSCDIDLGVSLRRTSYFGGVKLKEETFYDHLGGGENSRRRRQELRGSP